MIDPGTAIVFAERDVFAAATTRAACSTGGEYIAGRVACIQDAAMRDLLRRIVRALDSADWANDDADFAAACLAGGISYDEMLKQAQPRNPDEERDRARKELSDIGEIVTMLRFLSHDGLPPHEIFGKNILKLYEGVSEPGVDVVALHMDDDVPDGLGPDEWLTICESKASGGAAFRDLAGDAAASLGNVDEHRLQRELRLLAAVLKWQRRGGAAKRVRRFLDAYLARDPRVRAQATLTSRTDVPDHVDFPNVAALAGRLPLSLQLVDVDLEPMRDYVFAHRRGE